MKAAFRHLRRNRGRTVLTLLAVLIPVFFLVFFFGFSNAVVSDMFESATRIDTGHLQIRAAERRGMGSALPLLHEADEVESILAGMENISWRTTRLELPVLASSGARSQMIHLQGIVPEEIAPISTIGELIVEGDSLRTGLSGIVIGRELADALDVAVGDDVALLNAHPETGLGALKVPVVGVFEAPLAEMGRRLVHTTLETARRLARSPNAATAVVARVKGVTGPWDLDAIDAVTATLATQLPDGLEVLDWRALAPQVDGYMRILNPVMVIFGAVFFGLGALVVLNTLYLSVMERTRELGLILSLGASRRRVLGMILTEASLIAGAGALYGALLGVASLFLVEALGGIPLPKAFAEFTRAVGLSSSLHVMVKWPQVVWSAVSMAVAAILAAAFPAFRASKLEPVEAMSYVE